MKQLFTILTLILAFASMKAQDHYQFRTDAPQGFSIESSTASSLSLHYSISEIGIADIDNGEAKGQEIVLKGSFGSFAEGLPNLPFENRYVAIPNGATVSVKVKEHGCQTLSGIDLLPVAAVQGNAAVGLPKIQKDMSVFGKDANFPTNNVVIAQTTQIRGLDVVMLSVTPFRYNPVRKTLEVIYDMDIEIGFEGGNGRFGEARYRNPAWDGILRDLVINSDILTEAHYYELLNEAIQNREEGCEYLIISPDNEAILAYADTLRAFRTKQGVLTKVVSVTECGGNDANAIKGYIQNAYEHWTIPPAAVMIFSGVDTLEVGGNFYWASSGIPGFGLLFKGYDTGLSLIDYHYSSDNPYADMNGDSIPDLALSRLPALTLDEYRTQVNKLIQYETDPPTQPSYYDQPIITSSYEDNKWFLITSQSVNGFYRKKLGRHPKNFYMLYEYMSDEIPFPDTAWSIGYNTDVVVDYFGPNGQNYIAQRPDTLNNWRDMDDYSYLIDALNQNSFLTLYRDHSSYDLWCSPWMESYEVRHLKNTEPTFVLSIGCDAALYSNVLFYEFSDSYWSMGLNPMIFEFCKAKVGALGGIGATTVTHSHYNDILTWGIIDNFWPNYMPDMGTTAQPQFTRPAYALVAGKLFLNQHAFIPNWWPVKVTTTQNVFHYLGETYLNLYTNVPQQMAIEAAPCTDGQSQYSITAEEGATICLSHGDEILLVTQATGQPQDLTLPYLPIGEQIIVTVTKQNRFRFEKMVRVLSNDLPFVYVETAEVDDQDGNGQLDYGEYANFNITLNNYSEVTSAGGEITLHCDSPYIEILQGTAHYPQMGVHAIYKIENAFRIKLANNVPDQTVLQFKVRFNENENTHEDNISIIANAPVVTIDPEFRITTADSEPSTHINTEGKSYVTFSFKNSGHSTADHLGAALSIKAPFISMDTPRIMFDGLLPNESLSTTYEMTTNSNDITGAWLQSRLDVQYGDYHAVLDTIIQYGGIFENFETDTLNPYFFWTNNGMHKWVYCNEDAYEGQRCLESMADTLNASLLKARLREPYVGHDSKISFRYKTSNNEFIQYFSTNSSESIPFTADEWQYAEVPYNGIDVFMNWRYRQSDINSPQAKLDDLCFPPMHTAIAYAGHDVLSCESSMVELRDAYAYDCNSVYWTTEGDGHFDDETVVNPTYFPGSQDIADGGVELMLHAIGDSDTLSSATLIRFVDDINLGSIVGDSVVNKYESQISQYSVENLSGVNYVWQLEPAEAGVIYSHGNAIDLVWNLHEGDAEVTLSVKADNGCEVEPISMTIQLIGASLPEFNSISYKVFPNPTRGLVSIVVGENIHEKTVVEIYNVIGNRVIQEMVPGFVRGETLSYDLRPFGAGMYIIRLYNDTGSVCKKVCVIAN